MSELSGEMTRVEALKKDGTGRAETFLVSPPLSEREIDGITPGTRGEEFSDEETQVLKKLDDSAVMAKVSILSSEVEIDGTKGSLLVFDTQSLDENLAEDLALLGSVICRLRGQATLSLNLIPN